MSSRRALSADGPGAAAQARRAPARASFNASRSLTWAFLAPELGGQSAGRGDRVDECGPAVGGRLDGAPENEHVSTAGRGSGRLHEAEEPGGRPAGGMESVPIISRPPPLGRKRSSAAAAAAFAAARRRSLECDDLSSPLRRPGRALSVYCLTCVGGIAVDGRGLRRSGGGRTWGLCPRVRSAPLSSVFRPAVPALSSRVVSFVGSLCVLVPAHPVRRFVVRYRRAPPSCAAASWFSVGADDGGRGSRRSAREHGAGEPPRQAGVFELGEPGP